MPKLTAMRILPVFSAAVAAASLSACAYLGSVMTKQPTQDVEADPYEWLETVEGDRALAWVRAENERSLAVLKGDPRFAALQSEILSILEDDQRIATGSLRDGFIYNFWQDGVNVRGVWRRSPADAYAANAPRWETLLDVDALAAAENANWVFKGASCAPNGSTRCMIALSNGGKDAVVQREFDIAARRFVDGGFTLPEAKSWVEWETADTLLVGTDWGAGSLTESGYPMIARRWARGAPLADAQDVLRGQTTDIGLWGGRFEDDGGYHVLIATQADTFFTSSFWLLRPGEAALRLPFPKKSTILGYHKNEIVLRLQEAWSIAGQTFPQGAVVSAPYAALETGAAFTPRVVYAPAANETIEQIAQTRDGLLIAVYQDVRAKLVKAAFDGRAWMSSPLPTPENGALTIVTSEPQSSMAFALYQDFLTPSTLYALDTRQNTTRMARQQPARFDATPYTVDQHFVTSKDGVRVPYFVVRRKDLQADAKAPTLLYGYGGFEVSMTPSYAAVTGKAWLDRGGVYVLANIRGGGEYGPAWHEAGLKTNRQRIYDDFIAVAQDLIARQITAPRHLGVMGGSNGGLLMGAMLTQRPELFNAVVVQVPLLDMLGFADANMLAGASWVAEYGDPRLRPDGTPVAPQERAFLASISPYQNLRKRPDFPVPFFVTSTKDDRVHPAHARKYAARMQGLGMPFYYYENTDGGHAASANLKEAAKRRALEFVYLLRQLSDPPQT
jgi:prolyl oligopeptidase